MTSDTTINPLPQHEEDESQSATATEPTDHPDPEAEAPEQAPISVDEIFGVLQNERRRRALRYLGQRDEPVSVSELSEYIAALENDKPTADLTSQERKRVYVGLYQSHLPKLDDVGFIEYDKDRGNVELGPQAAHAEGYLQLGAPETRAWPAYYLGLVGIGWLVVLASFVLGPQATTVAVGVFLALTTALALAHAYSVYRDRAVPSFETPP